MTKSFTRRAVSARVHTEEVMALERLAARHDRTLSREVGRAIRFYLSHPEAATTGRQAGPESDAS